MKKRNLLLLFSLIGCTLQAQTELMSDNFAGGISNWTATTTGTNGWMVNNVYAGLDPLIADTPDQPVTIADGPQSEYLHIMNDAACNQFGACNANFDSGNSSIAYAELTNSLSTVGYVNTTVSFYYLCVGSPSNSYGSFEYSTDNGTSWTQAGSEYSDVTDWTLETLSLAAWDGVSDLKFRFRWENNSAGSDPAFSVDEFSVSAEVDVTSIDEIIAIDVHIYPNPAEDILHITGEVETLNSIDILDVDGRVVLDDIPLQTAIDIKNLESGVYYARFSNKDRLFTRRFMKK